MYRTATNVVGAPSTNPPALSSTPAERLPAAGTVLVNVTYASWLAPSAAPLLRYTLPPPPRSCAWFAEAAGVLGVIR